MTIIGISGSNGSGKDTIANMLGEKHGFYVASATEMLGDELTQRGLPHERVNKRIVSAEWRKEFGLGAIVDKAVEAAKAAGFDKVVVGSLRATGEVDRVHELGGKTIWFDADPEVRYARIQKGNRGRIEDQKTFEEFIAEEQVEMQPTSDVNGLNMSGVKAMADYTIINNKDNIPGFIAQAEAELKDLL